MLPQSMGSAGHEQRASKLKVGREEHSSIVLVQVQQFLALN